MRFQLCSIANEMQAAIIELAGPVSTYDNRKSWLARAAGRAGIRPRMARAMFDMERQNYGGKSIDAVRTALERKKALEQGTKNEPTIEDLANVLLSLAERLRADNPDEFRKTVETLRGLARKERGSLPPVGSPARKPKY